MARALAAVALGEAGRERRRRRRRSGEERRSEESGSGQRAGPGSRAHEQRGGGTKDISPRLADRAPTWPAAVSCHVGKSGKNVRFTTTVVLNL